MNVTVSIPKLAGNANAFRRTFTPFPNGRTAFKAILEDLNWAGERALLLPAYIGWSSREGSGVFDPVRATGIPFSFYKMTSNLNLDMDDLARQLKEYPKAVVLLIHYFGRIDPNYSTIIDWVQKAGGELIEDQAHALLTDLAGGRSGRGGRHGFFSFHKLLPVNGGGARILNGPAPTNESSLLRELQCWDLQAIAQARIRNFQVLQELMIPHRDIIEPLWPQLAAGEAPQTFPIKLTPGSGRSFRDQVYEHMNQLGFGVVSLYHTMIPELDPTQFPESFVVADSILNLPVHQDIHSSCLPAMVEALATQVRRLR